MQTPIESLASRSRMIPSRWATLLRTGLRPTFKRLMSLSSCSDGWPFAPCRVYQRTLGMPRIASSHSLGSPGARDFSRDLRLNQRLRKDLGLVQSPPFQLLRCVSEVFGPSCVLHMRIFQKELKRPPRDYEFSWRCTYQIMPRECLALAARVGSNGQIFEEGEGPHP